MCGVIVQARRFAINVLSARQESLSRHFSGQPVEDIPILFTELHSIPTLPDSLATLICSTNQVFDGGDHIIVLGQVEAFMRPECEGAPLIYYAGRYQQLATILG